MATTRNQKGQDLARYRLIHYLAVFFRNLDITELNGDKIRGYRIWLERESGLSANTIVHLLSDLRCLLRWAVSESLIVRSPFPSRVLPRIQEVPPRGFDDRELRMLTRMGGQAGFILRFLLGTGLRWAEACRARREHIRGELLDVAQTKSGRMRRVPLSPELLVEIAQQGERLVPLSEKSPGSFSRMIRRWTGIADFHAHRCRHTFAMRWLEAGGNLAVLQQILGHRDLSTTMRYARVTDDLITREAERVERLRRGEAEPESRG